MIRRIECPRDLNYYIQNYIKRNGWKRDEKYKQALVNENYSQTYLFISEEGSGVLYQIMTKKKDGKWSSENSDAFIVPYRYSGRLPVLTPKSMNTSFASMLSEIILEEEKRMIDDIIKPWEITKKLRNLIKFNETARGSICSEDIQKNHRCCQDCVIELTDNYGSIRTHFSHLYDLGKDVNDEICVKTNEYAKALEKELTSNDINTLLDSELIERDIRTLNEKKRAKDKTQRFSSKAL